MSSNTAKKNRSRGIKICIDLECNSVKFNATKLRSMLSQTCLRFGVESAQINLAIVDNPEIVKVNRKFLKSRKITDVISFDVSDEQDESFFDIIINAQLARKQAQKRQINPEAELALYALHGLLHNLGFDDISEDKAKKMHKTEDEILQEFGYGIVYNND